MERFRRSVNNDIHSDLTYTTSSRMLLRVLTLGACLMFVKGPLHAQTLFDDGEKKGTLSLPAGSRIDFNFGDNEASLSFTSSAWDRFMPTSTYGKPLSLSRKKLSTARVSNFDRWLIAIRGKPEGNGANIVGTSRPGIGAGLTVGYGVDYLATSLPSPLEASVRVDIFAEIRDKKIKGDEEGPQSQVRAVIHFVRSLYSLETESADPMSKSTKTPFVPGEKITAEHNIRLRSLAGALRQIQIRLPNEGVGNSQLEKDLREAIRYPRYALIQKLLTYSEFKQTDPDLLYEVRRLTGSSEEEGKVTLHKVLTEVKAELPQPPSTPMTDEEKKLVKLYSDIDKVMKGGDFKLAMCVAERFKAYHLDEYDAAVLEIAAQRDELIPPGEYNSIVEQSKEHHGADYDHLEFKINLDYDRFKLADVDSAGKATNIADKATTSIDGMLAYNIRLNNRKSYDAQGRQHPGHPILLGFGAGFGRKNNRADLSPIADSEALPRSDFEEKDAWKINTDFAFQPTNQVWLNVFTRNSLPKGAPDHRYGIGVFITEKGNPYKAIGGVATSWSSHESLRVDLIVGFHFGG